MKKPTRQGVTKFAAVATTPVAIALAGAMIFQASNAAFTGQTRNSGNTWSTPGQVTLTDDDNGAARFIVENMLPGDTDTKCITVTANTTVESTVKGYAVGAFQPDSGLADRIFITMVQGSGGSFESCDGFTASDTIAADIPLNELFDATNFGTGLGEWNIVPGDGITSFDRTYQVTWRFDTTGLNQGEVDALQGKKVGIDFQWEMRTD